jgi:hypothetical protein
MNWLSLRNNQLGFKTSGKLPIISKESTDIPPINKENPKDHSMSPVGLGNSRILTKNAKILPKRVHQSWYTA